MLAIKVQQRLHFLNVLSSIPAKIYHGSGFINQKLRLDSN